jgi:hypothetical protein
MPLHVVGLIRSAGPILARNAPSLGYKMIASRMAASVEAANERCFFLR